MKINANKEKNEKKLYKRREQRAFEKEPLKEKRKKEEALKAC